MAGLTQQEVRVVLKAVDQISPVLKQVQGNLAGFGKSVQDGFVGVGKAAAVGMAAAGAAMVAGAAAGVKAAADLEQAVANISTIKPEIDNSAVFKSLNEMQTRVPQSAAQLGESLYNVFSSIETSQEGALKLTEQFAKGAVGAQTDAKTFGTAVLGVMNAYGLAVEDAAHISDVFFNTVNRGVVTGAELAANLGPVTQSAKAAGVSLDQLGGFVAGVTKEGGSAAQNINNLHNLFQKITTKEAVKEMNNLGVATADQVGNFRPVEDVLTDLKARLGDMTEAQRANALQAIFPDAQARQGAQTLISQIDFVKSAIAANIESSGSAEAAFTKMNATFNSQMKILGNTFQSILATVGAEILPLITPLVTAFAQQLPAALQATMAALAPFGQLIGDTFRTIQQVFAGEWEPSAMIDPLVNSLGQLAIVARDQVLPAVTALAAQIGPLASQMGPLVPVVVALAAGFLAFQAISGIVGIVTGLGAAFAAASAAMAASSGIVAGVVAVLGGPVTVAIAAVAAAVALLAVAWTQNWGDIQGKTAAAWSAIQPVLTAIGTELGRFGSEMLPLVTAAWAGIQQAASTAMQVIGTLVAQGMAVLTAAWNGNWLGIRTGVEVAWAAIQAYVTVAWTFIQGYITAGLQVLAGDWAGAWQTVQSTVVSILGTVSNFVVGAMAQIVGAVANAAGDALAAAGQVASAIVQGLVNGINAGVGAVAAAAAGLVQRAIDAMRGPQGADAQSPSKKTYELGEDLWQGLNDALAAGQIDQSVVVAIRDMVEAARDYVPVGGEIARVEREIADIRERSTTDALFRAAEMVTVESELLRLKRDQVVAERDLLPIRQAAADAARTAADIERGSLGDRTALLDLSRQGKELRLQEINLERQRIGLDPQSKAAKAIDKELAGLRDKGRLLSLEADQIRTTNEIAASGAKVQAEQLADQLKGSEDVIRATQNQIAVLQAEGAVFTANEAIIKNATENEIRYRDRLKAVFAGESEPLRRRIEAGAALVQQLAAEGIISEAAAGKLRDMATAALEGGLSADSLRGVVETLDSVIGPATETVDGAAGAFNSLAENTDDSTGALKDNAGQWGKWSSKVKGSVDDVIDAFNRGDFESVMGSFNLEFPELRQHGGPVRAGRPYIVGEAGPELFMPKHAGTILPNDLISGDGGAFVSIGRGGADGGMVWTGDVVVNVPGGFVGSEQQLADRLREPVLKALRQHTARGGTVPR